MEKKTNKKTVIIAVGALVLLIGVFLTVWLLGRPRTTAGVKGYSVTVVHSDKSSKVFDFRTDEEYLGAALKNEGLVSGTVSEYGLMIETVDSERAVWAENGAYWALYIGGEYASTGVDSTPVNDGDSFSLEYTIG